MGLPLPTLISAELITKTVAVTHPDFKIRLEIISLHTVLKTDIDSEDNYRCRIMLPEKLFSTTDRDLWECWQNIEIFSLRIQILHRIPMNFHYRY